MMENPLDAFEDNLPPPPPGKVREYIVDLEMTSPPWGRGESAPPPAPLPEGYRLKLKSHLRPDDYLKVFKAVGQDWLWQGRLRLSEGALTGLLRDEDMEIFFLLKDDVPVGLTELDRRNGLDVEISYFGLVPGQTGLGLGRLMMAHTLYLAWTGNDNKHPLPKRVWLHTCQNDHPRALEFYQSSGFKVCGHSTAIVDDPRLMGLLPVSAAPHVAIATED